MIEARIVTSAISSLLINLEEMLTGLLLSEVWGGRNNTFDKTFNELSFRGITRDEYASILQELVERGWIKQVGETYQPTAEGKRIREEAEALTNYCFFGPGRV